MRRAAARWLSVIAIAAAPEVALAEGEHQVPAVGAEVPAVGVEVPAVGAEVPVTEPAPPGLTLEELLSQAEEAAEVIVVDDRAPAEAASSVHFSREELRRRPGTQPSDLLRQTPGLFVSQHAGGGKADQYFLRGFDADHGTDVAIFVDGIPVNLTSHGHGQGYADSHWIIPETIASLDVHKGPYAARYGDFYTAGAIELRTVDTLEWPTLWFTGGTELAGPVAGQRLSSRLVGMATPEVGGGKALVAAELAETDGPFLSPQGYRRGALISKWKRALGPGALRVASTFYTAEWSQSGQIPAGEVAAGRLDRFGSLDPSEGGSSMRGSVAVGYDLDRTSGARWKLDAYAVGYQLDLFSNFTLFARDTMNGDQIEQNDRRMLYGGSAVYHRAFGGDGPVQALVAAGAQARLDDVTTDLWHTHARARLGDCWDNPNPCNRTASMILGTALFSEADVAIKNKLHFLPGVRVDGFGWSVDDLDRDTMGTAATTGGGASALIASPKLSVVLHATPALDLFVNSGRGFHSNDARAAVASSGRGAIASAWGAEAGTRVHPGSGVRASFAVWTLRLSSEQVWSGDFGGTEPSDPTTRNGIDADIAWDVTPWLSLDGNVAVARTAYLTDSGAGGALPLAPRLMGGGGVSVRHGVMAASLRTRGLADRPANDDGSLVAEGFVLIDAVASYRLGRAELTLTINNLLDAAWREAQFAEESRPTPDGMTRADVHFTPGMPLTAMLTLGMSY